MVFDNTEWTSAPMTTKCLLQNTGQPARLYFVLTAKEKIE